MGNLSSFLSGLQTGNPLISKIERLHLYNGDYSEEPPYRELLTSEIWSSLDTPSRPLRLVNKRTFYSLLKENQICNEVGAELKRRVNIDPTMLSRLRTVSLGDLTNLDWMSPGFKEMERLSNYPTGHDLKNTPHLLINLPNVEHVCQMTRFGPHALYPGLYAPSHPPEVFTYHCNLPSRLCICTEEVGPIVLGAINRLYYTCTFAVDHMPFVNPWGVMQDQTRVQHIVQRLNNSPVVTLTEDGASVGQYTDELDIGSTTLEICDYVRYRATPPDGRPELAWARGHSYRACQPAATMVPFQALLDEALPEKWKGRVIMKDREEAPPCTACGLNLKEQWDYTVDLMGHGNRNVLRCEIIHP